MAEEARWITATRRRHTRWVIHTIGFAAFGTRPPLHADAAVPIVELAGNFDSGLRWLLAGITAGLG